MHRRGTSPVLRARAFRASPLEHVVRPFAAHTCENTHSLFKRAHNNLPLRGSKFSGSLHDKLDFGARVAVTFPKFWFNTQYCAREGRPD